MKLSKSILIKDSTSLFSNKYKYKICIVTPVSGHFRRKDLPDLPSVLKLLKPDDFYPKSRVKQSDIDYAVKVGEVLQKEEDFLKRIENPFLNIYTNSTKLIESLANIDPDKVKFIYMPNKNKPEPTEGTVLVKNLDFGFKVHLGVSRQNHSNFVSWAKDNPKVRLTKRCIKDLSKDRNWGGGYFYVKDSKTLTMVKMFLTDSISKVETVIKA